MRILQVVHGFPPTSMAGTEIYTYNLAKALSRRHDVYIFYPVLDRKGAPYRVDFCERDGLKIYTINAKRPLLENCLARLKGISVFDLRQTNKVTERRFIEILEKVNPDIVHFQHLCTMPTISLIELAKKRDIPCFLTLHDYWFICPELSLLTHNHAICQGPDEEADNCYRCFLNSMNRPISKTKVRYFARRLAGNLLVRLLKRQNKRLLKKRQFYMENILLKDIDLIFAPSRFLRDIFVSRGVPEEKVVYLPYGCDSKSLEGIKKKKSDKIIFGFVGTLTKGKGVDVLIEAFNKVTDTNTELRVYGPTPKTAYFRYLTTLIKNPNVKLMGKFFDAKMPYSEIDVLIFPSIWYESSPLVLSEAIATKTPIIGSNIGPVPEFIEEGHNGFLFRRGDAGDLYRKIKLLSNRQTIEELRLNKKRAVPLEEKTEMLEGIYASVARV